MVSSCPMYTMWKWITELFIILYFLFSCWTVKQKLQQKLLHNIFVMLILYWFARDLKQVFYLILLLGTCKENNVYFHLFIKTYRECHLLWCLYLWSCSSSVSKNGNMTNLYTSHYRFHNSSLVFIYIYQKFLHFTLEYKDIIKMINM